MSFVQEKEEPVKDEEEKEEEQVKEEEKVSISKKRKRKEKREKKIKPAKKNKEKVKRPPMIPGVLYKKIGRGKRGEHVVEDGWEREDHLYQEEQRECQALQEYYSQIENASASLTSASQLSAPLTFSSSSSALSTSSSSAFDIKNIHDQETSLSVKNSLQTEEKLRQEWFQELTGWTLLVEDVFCPKCKIACTFMQNRTRSADEGMNMFWICPDCGYKKNI